ncbi:uncharacterized protein LOC142362039 [Opisthocomus hoazin]|uniref:uncharacterized protein LOC142362039 n=1 Tax=Opisthocomus hoazin TaxID=30419 RepID=UPI003F52982B
MPPSPTSVGSGEGGHLAVMAVRAESSRRKLSNASADPMGCPRLPRRCSRARGRSTPPDRPFTGCRAPGAGGAGATAPPGVLRAAGGGGPAGPAQRGLSGRGAEPGRFCLCEGLRQAPRPPGRLDGSPQSEGCSRQPLTPAPGEPPGLPRRPKDPALGSGPFPTRSLFARWGGGGFRAGSRWDEGFPTVGRCPNCPAQALPRDSRAGGDRTRAAGTLFFTRGRLLLTRATGQQSRLKGTSISGWLCLGLSGTQPPSRKAPRQPALSHLGATSEEGAEPDRQPDNRRRCGFAQPPAPPDLPGPAQRGPRRGRPEGPTGAERRLCRAPRLLRPPKRLRNGNRGARPAPYLLFFPDSRVCLFRGFDLIVLPDLKTEGRGGKEQRKGQQKTRLEDKLKRICQGGDALYLVV